MHTKRILKASEVERLTKAGEEEGEEEGAGEGRGGGRGSVGTCIYPYDALWISSVRISSFLFSSSGCSQGWAGLDRSA